MNHLQAHNHATIAAGCLESALQSIPEDSYAARTEVEIALDHINRARVDMAQMWQLHRSQNPATTSEELALLGRAAVVP